MFGDFFFFFFFLRGEEGIRDLFLMIAMMRFLLIRRVRLAESCNPCKGRRVLELPKRKVWGGGSSGGGEITDITLCARAVVVCVQGVW